MQKVYHRNEDSTNLLGTPHLTSLVSWSLIYGSMFHNPLLWFPCPKTPYSWFLYLRSPYLRFPCTKAPHFRTILLRCYLHRIPHCKTYWTSLNNMQRGNKDSGLAGSSIKAQPREIRRYHTCNGNSRTTVAPALPITKSIQLVTAGVHQPDTLKEGDADYYMDLTTWGLMSFKEVIMYNYAFYIQSFTLELLCYKNIPGPFIAITLCTVFPGPSFLKITCHYQWPFHIFLCIYAISD